MLADRCLSVCPVYPVLPVCNVGVLWPDGWMDRDETWHAGRPWPWPHCVRWGPSSPSSEGAEPPVYGPYLLLPMAAWIKMPHGREVGLGPGDFVIDGNPAPLPKRGQSPLPNFRPMSIVVKRLDGSRWHLAWRWPWSKPHCTR